MFPKENEPWLSEIARVTTQNIIKLEARKPFLEGTYKGLASASTF